MSEYLCLVTIQCIILGTAFYQWIKVMWTPTSLCNPNSLFELEVQMHFLENELDKLDEQLYRIEDKLGDGDSDLPTELNDLEDDMDDLDEQLDELEDELQVVQEESIAPRRSWKIHLYGFMLSLLFLYAMLFILFDWSIKLFPGNQMPFIQSIESE